MRRAAARCFACCSRLTGVGQARCGIGQRFFAVDADPERLLRHCPKGLNVGAVPLYCSGWGALITVKTHSRRLMAPHGPGLTNIREWEESGR